MIDWPLTEPGSYHIANSSSNDFVHPLFLSHILTPNSEQLITHELKTLLRIIHLNYSRFDNLIGTEKSIGMNWDDLLKYYLFDPMACGIGFEYPL